VERSEADVDEGDCARMGTALRAFAHAALAAGYA
jgi:hypothetical protein